MKIRNKLSIFESDRVVAFSFAMVLLLVSFFYSGKLFVSHMNNGIAAGAYDLGVVEMLPGDHHEQFYRYSLFYNNLIRGRLPYYSGYQFASTQFTEGLINFPFTAIVGLLSFILGPILAYNVMALLSYVFVGLSCFYLIKHLTKSRSAGIVAGLFMATVPFRLGFLYGQMGWGVDACIIPLLIYYIEKAKETAKGKHFFIVGLILFMFFTANFQLFYWAMFLLSPYYIFVIVDYLKSPDFQLKDKLKPLLWLLPGLFSTVSYILYIYSLLNRSSLKQGQAYAETLSWTPKPHQLFNTWNGNEANVYLGFTALFVLPWLLSPMLKYRQAEARTPYIPLFMALFLVGMLLVFGPFIDSALKLPFYQWMFDNIPGFNGTRTTGRIMGVVIVFYSILLGYAIAALSKFITTEFSKDLFVMIVFIISCAILYDFKFLMPKINTFEQENKAYRAIAGSREKIVPLPFQENSGNHLNSTFLTYALKYDLRLLVGHSSYYPKAVDEQVKRLFSLNIGIIDFDQWKWLRDNDYKYIVAHATQFQPNVNQSVISNLLMSPYLKFMLADNGVHLYQVRSDAVVDLGKGLNSINYDIWATSIDTALDQIPDSDIGANYIYGWYDREVYADQKPFRWMRGVNSVIAIRPNKQTSRGVSLEYWCPYPDPVKISLHRIKADVKIEPLIGGWTKAAVQFQSNHDSTIFISLEAPRIFSVPTDYRKFGCQVRDVQRF